MKKKILLVLVLSIFLLAIFAGGALAANKASRYNKASVAPPVNDEAQTPVYGAPTPVMYEGDKGACDNINPDTAVHVIQHDQWGTTYYDEQQVGSMARMIAVGPGGYRHMVFQKTYGYPYGNPPNYPRYVAYNCKDPTNTWLDWTAYPIDGGTNINAGYANIAVTHTGREVVVYHRSAGSPNWYSTLAVADSGYICQGYFTHRYDLPDKIQGEPNENRGMWPKMGILYDPIEDRDYIHIVETETSRFSYFPFKPPYIPPQPKAYSYQRCYFSGSNLICESPGGFGPYVRQPNIAYSSALDQINSFDTGYTVSSVVACSPVSQKLAIVYTKPLNMADEFEEKCDVWYFESTNNGDDWFTSWPPNRINITNYPDTNSEFAYMDVAACYDCFDSLHIVWNTSRIPNFSDHDPPQTNLYHWSRATGTTLIASALWTDTRPGHFNRNISKMSISAKDTIYHPGDPPYLFVTWTQFDPGDKSASGMSNGDIYVAGSCSRGAGWENTFNLTNTKTPNCTPGNCLSEHWSSMAENMYNGDLHIEYVCDRDAGGVVSYPQEGAWTDNAMMYLHVAEPPIARCRVTYSLDPPSFTTPPIKVSPSGSRAIWIRLKSTGCVGGNYQVTSDNPKVICTSNCSDYLSPGQAKDVGWLITCSGEAFINATITIIGCKGTAEEDTIKLPLYAVCDANDYYECKRARETKVSIFNDLCSLWVCVNTSQEVYDLRVHDDQGKAQRSIYSAGTFVATSSGSDTVIGRQEDNFSKTGARDTIRVLQGVDFFEASCWIKKIHAAKTYIWYPPAIPLHPVDPKWWWISINKQVILFSDYNGTCPAWKKEQVIKYYWIKYARPPVWWPNPGNYPGHEDIYFGVFADPDAPSDTGCGSCNTAGWENDLKIMWQHGRYAGQHPEYNDYYVGLALTDTLGGVVDPYAAKDVTNDTFIYPQSGWRDDQLFQLASTPGHSIYLPDSVKDRSMVLTAYKIPAGFDSTFQSEFVLIEALIKGNTGTGLQQLRDHIDTTRHVLIPELKKLKTIFRKSLPICGDFTLDGVVDASDLISVLNYLFAKGPMPPWVVADVNMDGVVDASDLIYLLNYLFAKGPKPKCFGLDSPS